MKWQVFVHCSICFNPLFSQTMEVTQLIESGKNHWIFHQWSSAQQIDGTLTHVPTQCWHIHKPLVDEMGLLLMILYLWLQIPNELGKSHCSLTHFWPLTRCTLAIYIFSDNFLTSARLKKIIWPFIFHFQLSLQLQNRNGKSAIFTL